MPIRILLANDHPIIRNNLRSLLEREADFQVVAEAANGREAVVLADYKKPDVVLLEVKMPHVTGIAAARELAAKAQSCGVIFVSTETDEVYLAEAFKAGARGYVPEEEAHNELADAVRMVASGQSFISPSLRRREAAVFRGERETATGVPPSGLPVD